MLALLFLLGSSLLGIWLTRRALRSVLDGPEQILWGTVSGWILTAFGVYFVARWQGQLTSRLLLFATLVVWVVSAVLWLFAFRAGPALSIRNGWRRQYSGLLVTGVLFLPVYWRLLSTHVFAPGPDGLYSGGSAGYDLNFHASVITSFVYGQNFPPVYTLLPPEPILYPYMPDFHAAALMAAGFSLRASLMVTAIVLGLVTIGLFYSLALRIARSQMAATLATILFLLNGGTGFTEFVHDWWTSDKNIIEFWNTLSLNYAKLSERHLHWTNIVTDMMIPQRASLFGLPLALMIFTIFTIAWQRFGAAQPDASETPQSRRGTLLLMFVAGILAGLLPLFHTHSYISVGLVSLVLFAFRPRREWLAFWIPAVVLASPQLLGLAQHATGTGIVRWLPGWLGHDDRFFPWYLVRNFGLPLLLAIPAWFAAPREWRIFYLAFVLLIVFSFTIVVSPNIFDNGKPTYYWHAINSILVAAWLIKLATVHRQRLVALLLGFLCVATGITVLRSESLATMHLFTDEELRAVLFVREQTPPQALFLTAPSLNQPVLCLSGRPVVRGASAWIWSHGYEFRERENDVRRIYAGAADAFDLLRYYGVDYIYLGPAERSDLMAQAAFFDANFPAIYRSPAITIYDAHQLRGNGPLTRENPPPRELASRLERDPFSLIAQFGRTSYFVYRLCKVSYGRMPRRAEFLTAMTLLGKNLFAGASGWEQTLSANRALLLNDWTNSAEFKEKHGAQPDADVVDSLLRNAGLNWGKSKRDALVNSLSQKLVSRPAALLSLIEERELYRREYNNAWVLVHFFGYLRRNPDDAPDFDLKGFNFWRGRLDSWGDYRTISLAFIESDEYRNMKLAP